MAAGTFRRPPTLLHRAIAWFMEHTCAASGHFAACALLNRRVYLFYDERRDTFRIDLPSPTYRLWCWANGLPA